MNNIQKKFRFRAFPVYKEALEFNMSLKKVTSATFPKHERFGLLSQLWRSLDSISLNIAEGSERASDKDFAHFLNMSSASLNEVVACLDIALMNKYVSQEFHSECLENAWLLGNQLTAFRKKLLK